MVAKIKFGKSIRGMLTYNENKVEKGEANLILASGFAMDIERLNLSQKIQRFSKLTDLNTRVKTNAIHISLNFDVSDKLDVVKLQKIAIAYMEKLGFSDQPYIVYQHYDAAHPHLHIASTVVQKDAKRKITHDIGRLASEPARKMIENEFNLVKAEGRNQGETFWLAPAIYGEKPTKQQISSILQGVMANYSFTSLAEFNAILAQFNIRADRGREGTMVFEKKGLLYLVIDQKGQPIGVPIKASSFYFKPTLLNLEKKFAGGLAQRISLKLGIISRINQVLEKYEQISKTTFISELAKLQLATVIRRNEKGVIYGITFVDHKQKTVFNGSELGKGYSANEILNKLGDFDKVKNYLNQGAKSNYLQKTTISLDTAQTKAFNTLEVLLEKAAYDEPSVIGKIRKKKKGKSIT